MSRLAIVLAWRSELSNERLGSRLSGAEFTRGMLAEAEKAEVLAQFGGHGLITDVVATIGDGKEATVYLCAADPSVGVDWLAAKVYRAAKFRAFRGGRTYAGERTALDSRAKRAMRTKTEAGRRIAHHEWVAWEWETLCRLHDAGADVPEPLASSDDAILMELVGDGEGAAPKLRHVRALGGRGARGARTAAAQRRDLPRPAISCTAICPPTTFCGTPGSPASSTCRRR